MAQERRPNTSSSRTSAPPRGPEKKIGPFASGIGVAVWLNAVQGDDGTTRMVRSITLSPRRYRDRQSGEWKDSGSYHPGDIPALVFALQKALEFVITTPLPGQSDDELDHPGRPAF